MGLNNNVRYIGSLKEAFNTKYGDFLLLKLLPATKKYFYNVRMS